MNACRELFCDGTETGIDMVSVNLWCKDVLAQCVFFMSTFTIIKYAYY